MFGFFNRLRGPETRSSEIDVGSLYASVFGLAGGAYNFAQSPAILVSSLAVLDNAGALLTESRRLGRTSPLLIAYRAVIECGLLTGLPEAPEFPDSVPEAVAKAVAGMWIDMHDCDRERDLLDRLVLDGEFLILDDDTVIPPDGFSPIMAGPKWNRVVVGYKIGTGSRARMAGLRYVGDRPMGASRALPWIAPALPPGGWLTQCPHRRRARHRHHGEDRQRHLEREPRQDHRVGGRAVGPRGPSRDGGSGATADPLGERRIGPVSANRRGSEAHPDRPGRNGPQV